MALISSPGLGSGLDITSLTKQLVQAEIAPVSQRLDKKEINYQARLSALGSLKGALSAFQPKLLNLSSPDAFDVRKASVSNKEAFSASVTSSAVVDKYSIVVTQLAQSQTLVTDVTMPYKNLSDIIGTGTLSFQFGTGPIGSFVQNVDRGSFSITIDSSNNTLAGLRDAINDADIGVQASVVNNGIGYLLSFTSTHTGANNSMKVSVADDGDGNDTDVTGLSALTYDVSANMTETITAQDVSLTINGISVSSDNNKISNAIEGVTLEMLDVQSGSLAVSLDEDGVKEKINEFISGYNSLIGTINDLTSYNPDTRIAGILNGDSGTRIIVSKMRNIISTNIDVLSGSFSSLSGLGITSQSDGRLLLNDVKLQDALDSNFSDVTTLFSAIGTTTDALIGFESATIASVANEYDIVVSILSSKGNIAAKPTAALAEDGAGNFLSAFIIDENNDQFTLIVNGITSGPLKIENGSYATTGELVAAMQSKINADKILSNNGVSVTVEFKEATASLSFTSSLYGADSTLSFASVDINSAADLGMDPALVGVDGVDAAGTIGGVAAVGNGQYLLGAEGSATEGIEIKVQGHVLGERGSIEFSRGIADQLNRYLTDLLDSKVISLRIETIEDGIDRLDMQREVLARREEALEARLMAKFTSLDLLVTKLQSTSTFLVSQLDSIGKWAIGGSR